MKTPEIPQEALEQMKREGWATMESQSEYWKKKDAELDRTEATCDYFDHENFDGPEFQTLGEYESDSERNR